jgi:imidazole glycerol-phosphate synthase subunit HisF
MYKRLIPVIQLIEEDAVKTCGFRDPVYVGDPINILKIFNEKDADEICFLDISATSHGRPPDVDFIADLTSESFIPVSYGGGICDIEQASSILAAGVEKVVLQTALFNHSLCTEITDSFGQQALVGSVDVVDQDTFLIGEQKLSFDEVQSIVSNSNCGEILFQHIEREGTCQGADHALAHHLVQAFDIPVVFSGGLSSNTEIDELLKSGLSGIGVGAHFIFTKSRAVLISYYERKY